MTAPTKAEVDEVLARVARDDNRAVAREAVSLYRARRLNEMQSANHAQMQGAVKGGDEYDYHYPRLARRFLRFLKRWSDKT